MAAAIHALWIPAFVLGLLAAAALLALAARTTMRRPPEQQSAQGNSSSSGADQGTVNGTEATTASAAAWSNDQWPSQRVAPVALRWRAISLSTLAAACKHGDRCDSPNGCDYQQKQSIGILRDVSGGVAPGQMHAVIGPSGAGKTSLLDVLSSSLDTLAGRQQQHQTIKHPAPHSAAAGARSGCCCYTPISDETEALLTASGGGGRAHAGSGQAEVKGTVAVATCGCAGPCCGGTAWQQPQQLQQAALAVVVAVEPPTSEAASWAADSKDCALIEHQSSERPHLPSNGYSNGFRRYELSMAGRRPVQSQSGISSGDYCTTTTGSLGDDSEPAAAVAAPISRSNRPWRHALVPQHVSFPPTLTAAEVLTLQARLMGAQKCNLGSSMSGSAARHCRCSCQTSGGGGGIIISSSSSATAAVADADSLLLPPPLCARRAVEEVALALQLGGQLHTLVGGVLTGGTLLRGLSGGERRRLALAAALLPVAPSVLLLDEPTSGLDSATALSVMSLVASSAARARGCAVVAAVHQPRPELWRLFDTASVLSSGGRLAYCGDAQDACLSAWFSGCLGVTHSPDAHGSVVDWVVDLVSPAAASAAAVGAAEGAAQQSQRSSCGERELQLALPADVKTHQVGRQKEDAEAVAVPDSGAAASGVRLLDAELLVRFAAGDKAPALEALSAAASALWEQQQRQKAISQQQEDAAVAEAAASSLVCSGKTTHGGGGHGGSLQREGGGSVRRRSDCCHQQPRPTTSADTKAAAKVLYEVTDAVMLHMSRTTQQTVGSSSSSASGGTLSRSCSLQRACSLQSSSHLPQLQHCCGSTRGIEMSAPAAALVAQYPQHCSQYPPTASDQDSQATSYRCSCCCNDACGTAAQPPSAASAATPPPPPPSAGPHFTYELLHTVHQQQQGQGQGQRATGPCTETVVSLTASAGGDVLVQAVTRVLVPSAEAQQQQQQQQQPSPPRGTAAAVSKAVRRVVSTAIHAVQKCCKRCYCCFPALRGRCGSPGLTGDVTASSSGSSGCYTRGGTVSRHCRQAAAAPWITQVALLSWREWLCLARNVEEASCRLVVFALGGMLVGLVFYGVGGNGGGGAAGTGSPGDASSATPAAVGQLLQRAVDSVPLASSALFTNLAVLMTLPYASMMSYAGDAQQAVADAAAGLFSPSAYVAAKTLSGALPALLAATLSYSSIAYGLEGLSPTASSLLSHLGISCLLAAISSGLLHLCVLLFGLPPAGCHDTAMAAATAWAALNLYLCDFFVTPPEMAAVGRAVAPWLQYLTPVRWALQGMVRVELAARGTAVLRLPLSAVTAAWAEAASSGGGDALSGFLRLSELSPAVSSALLNALQSHPLAPGVQAVMVPPASHAQIAHTPPAPSVSQPTAASTGNITTISSSVAAVLPPPLPDTATTAAVGGASWPSPTYDITLDYKDVLRHYFGYSLSTGAIFAVLAAHLLALHLLILAVMHIRARPAR